MRLSLGLTLLTALLLAAPAHAAPRLIFPLTVSWEVLRSGFSSSADVALVADYFSEEWTVTLSDRDEILIQTPRGKALGLALKTGDSSWPFELIAVPAYELAHILGVQDEAVEPTPDPLFLSFALEDREDQFFAFKSNPKFYLTVTFRIHQGPGGADAGRR